VNRTFKMWLHLDTPFGHLSSIALRTSGQASCISLREKRGRQDKLRRRAKHKVSEIPSEAEGQKSNYFLPLHEKTCHCETRGASRSNLGQKQILRPVGPQNDISFLVTTCCRGAACPTKPRRAKEGLRAHFSLDKTHPVVYISKC